MGQAKLGNVFIHKGAGSKCVDCEYHKVCVMNVEPGRVYIIIKVRDKTHQCKQYETEMKVVEVTHAGIPVSLPAKQAISGVVVQFKTPECQNEACDCYELCFPLGLKDGDRCEVLEVTVNLECPEGLSRKKVSLRLASAS